MSDSSGRQTARRAAAPAVAGLIALAIAATSAAAPASGGMRPSPRATAAGALRLPGRGAGLADRSLAVPHRAAAAADTPCGQTPGLVCSQVVVPLDRTGVVPGTVSLAVQVLPALGTPRGVMFLIAGGPGQGSAHVSDLGSPVSASNYRYLFPGYTLVAYDDRGTGDSGVLRCPGLQNSVSIDVETGLAAACAASLGPQRDFYSTREHAEDLEAVRQSLGVDKVGLWGTSYGTKLALAYALAHPDHVDRLLLDSVVPPERDTFESSSLKAIPRTLSAYCGGGFCRSATSNLAGDVVTVANRLAAKPVQVKVLQPNGTKKTEKINGLAFLSLVIDADLSVGLAAELPAIVHAARLGNPEPLLRAFQLDSQNSIELDEDLSWGLFAATVCRDGPFPWRPDTPIGDRPALLNAAINALPAGSLGPFGTWAASTGTASLCLQWPAPSGGAPLGPGPLPDVPVLAISGGFDMRTPTQGAIDVVSAFPQGHLLVVPGVGHSVLSSSSCAQQAVHDWMLGRQPAASCTRQKPVVDLVPAYADAPQTAKTMSTARTLAVVSQTLRDAAAIFLMASPGQRIAGIAGGSLTASVRGFTLVRYSVTPGVELSGKLRIGGTGLPLKFQGAVTVDGARAATGVLGVSADKLAGTLDGRIVRG